MMIIVKDKDKHQDEDKHLCRLQEYNLVLGDQVLGLGSQHFLAQTLHLKHTNLLAYIWPTNNLAFRNKKLKLF